MSKSELVSKAHKYQRRAMKAWAELDAQNWKGMHPLIRLHTAYQLNLEAERLTSTTEHYFRLAREEMS